MSWTDNLILFLKMQKRGKCPNCGSETVVTKEYNYGRHSIEFHCEKCGSTAFFDGCIEKTELR